MSDLPGFVLIGIILLLTALSAYFSGSETAMIGLNRYRLRHLVKERHRGARKANRLLKRPDRLLGMILLGNNLVNFTAASIGTIVGIRYLGEYGVVLAPVLLTLFFLIFRRGRTKNHRRTHTGGHRFPIRLCSRTPAEVFLSGCLVREHNSQRTGETLPAEGGSGRMRTI